jgi:hypothetical protein
VTFQATQSCGVWYPWLLVLAVANIVALGWYILAYQATQLLAIIHP